MTDSKDNHVECVLSHPAYHDHLINIFKLSENTMVENEAVSNRISFPTKLFAMLVCLHESNDNTAVSWLPHGRAFTILDKTLFETSVLPIYFDKQTKYASFQRQLNMYGFMRLSGSNREQSGYYHELFLRGHPSLSARIARLRNCNNNVRRKYDPASEPDFDRMTPVAGNQTYTQIQIELWNDIAKRAFPEANQGFTNQATKVPSVCDTYSVSTPNHLMTPFLGPLVVHGFAPHHNATLHQISDVRSYPIAISPAPVSPINIKYDHSRQVWTSSAESKSCVECSTNSFDSVPKCLPMINLSSPCSELETNSTWQHGCMMSPAAATQESVHNTWLIDSTKTGDDSDADTADWLENLDVDTFW